MHGWYSSVGCDSFKDETYRGVKMSGNNVRGRIVRGRNVWGRNIPVPENVCEIPGPTVRTRG
jgi:hypothetical protein